jgi:hypothetical protein
MRILNVSPFRSIFAGALDEISVARPNVPRS